MVRKPHYKDHFSSGQVVVLIAEFYSTYINSGQAKNILYAGTGFFSVAYIEFYKTWVTGMYMQAEHLLSSQSKPVISKTPNNSYARVT